ncbi:MAG: Hydroperoxy fatty acid reductase gpx1 [Alphaproteobacteria bacterium MarineAlpha9_Bin6]|nr:MAG: Hydroperoxy fatty acid reductase gpx1 [Alphaproteobacteria bacterium MarineAlpha9_Bin6]
MILEERDRSDGKPMKHIFAVTVLSLVVFFIQTNKGEAMNAHDFDFESIDGAPMAMENYTGKVVLLVNTASFCGFTPQYTALQSLWQNYRDRGLVVLGVPSNDFGGQEPHAESDIKDFCVTNFGVDFPMTTKQHVIGPNAHPLYKWIVNEAGEDSAPRWNFHKYLIGPDGELAGLWPSRVNPTDAEIVGAIEPLLPE